MKGIKKRVRLKAKICLLLFILWVTTDGAKLFSIELRILPVAK